MLDLWKLPLRRSSPVSLISFPKKEYLPKRIACACIYPTSSDLSFASHVSQGLMGYKLTSDIGSKLKHMGCQSGVLKHGLINVDSGQIFSCGLQGPKVHQMLPEFNFLRSDFS